MNMSVIVVMEWNIIKFLYKFPGPYAGDGGWANYFKIMQFFTRNWVYTPNLGLKITFLKIRTPFVKTLTFAPLSPAPPPPAPPPPLFQKSTTGLVSPYAD